MRKRFDGFKCLLVAGCMGIIAGCATSGSMQQFHTSENASVRHDAPGEATQFRLQKRLADGMKELPVEQLLAAREQMKGMPQHSSGMNMHFANEAEARSRAPSAINAAWSALGPGNVGGRARSMVIDPNNPSIMYVGAVSGGVWKTTNAGASWSPVSDTMANLAVVSLAMDPTNSSILYAGTGEGSFNVDAIRGAGIFKSTDAGANWTRLASTTSSNFHYVNDLMVAPSNNQTVVAATNTGIFVSLDGGGNFTQRSTVTRCMDLAVTTITGTDTWLAACGNFNQGSVLRSTDTINWPSTLSEADMGRSAVAIRGLRAYVIATSRVAGFDRTGDKVGDYEDQLHAFFKSEDGGQTWTPTVRNSDPHHGNTMLLSGYFSCATLGLGAGQGWYDITVSIDPVNSDIVWVAGVNVFRSDNAGVSWGRADSNADGSGAVLHPDHHLLAFHPQFNGTSNQTIYNLQDGGIYSTNNARNAVAVLPAATGGSCSPSNAVTWTSLNNNYAATQFYHGTAYPDGTSYLAGAQDNGTTRGTDAAGPNSWSFLTCGDGGYTAVNPSNTNVLYAGCQNIDIRKSTNGGTSFPSADSGIATNEATVFIPPFAMDPNTPDTLWFGGSRAWRTTDAAVNWVAGSTLFNGGGQRVSAIAIAPGNSNLVLMAGTSSTARIFRTTSGSTSDGTTVWSNSTINGSATLSGYISAIAFAPSDANTVYASVSTFGAPHVLKSIDGGVTFTTVTGNSQIPDVPVLSVVVHPNNANRVYVGTDVGVFVSLDGGANWAAELTSFPNVSTEWLQITGTGNAAQLFAFTHGRGAFKLSLAAGPGNLAVATAAQTVAEGNVAQVQVNRTNGSDGAVAVSYTTGGGTATSGVDYTFTSGTLNWANGDNTPKTISVNTATDGSTEPDETFNVTLSGPTNGATLGASTHTVTIREAGVFPPNCQFPAGFTTPGISVPWTVSTDSVHEGACSLKSGDITHSQNSRIEYQGNFVAGNITFHARVSSELGWDCFRLLIDGVRQNIGNSCSNSTNPGVSGDTGWLSYTVPITAGAHTVTWSYEKDSSAVGFLDASWIDLVNLPLASTNVPPTFTSAAPGSGTFNAAYPSHTFTASGTPTPTFALQSGAFPNGLNLSGAVLAGTPTAAGTFTGVVRASNVAGFADQNFNIVIAAVVSSAPVLNTVTPGNGQATLNFTAPSSNGGASILDYTATCIGPNTVNLTQNATSITLAGMTNGQTYNCSVTARNSVGPSVASNVISVTPTALVDAIFGNGFE